MVVLPGDTGTTFVPAGTFDYYQNDNSVIGNPSTASDFNGYLRSRLRDGSPFTNDFVGAGTASSAHGSGPAVNYVYPGEPSDTAQWSECAAANNPGDRRFIISSNDFTLVPGQVKKIVMALVVTDTGVGGCPNANFNGIKVVADTAWNIFYHPLPPLPSAITNIAFNDASVNVYPNPTHDKLFIETTAQADEHIAIYNTIGQLINVPVTGSGKKREVSLAAFPAGIYYLLYRSGAAQQAIRFEKE